MQAPFVFQGTSTELFRWAVQREVDVHVMVLERMRDRGDLLLREAAWTQAAIEAQWLLPGVERWGAKSKKTKTSPKNRVSMTATPDFNMVNFSHLKLLSDVVAGRQVQDFRLNSAAMRDTANKMEQSTHEKHSIQLLVNPANNQPFYVGITRPKDGLLEPGDGDEVAWRADIFAAVHRAKSSVQVVEIERVEGMANAKNAKLFWIEMLARSNTKLINNERPKHACSAAHHFHASACGLLGGDHASSLDKSINPLSDNIGEMKVSPSLPLRHGEKWSTEEASSVQTMYERGVHIHTIAIERDRKATSILARLAKLAKSDSQLATRLRAASLLKSDGRPDYSGLS